MKSKSVWRHICPALLLFLVLCVFWVPGVSAEEAPGIRVEITQTGASSVYYRVLSDQAYPNAVAVTAAYLDGQLCQTAWDAFDMEIGVHEKTQSFSQAFDTCKVFLLDGETFAPICENGGLKQVRFVDHDGTLLSEQSVYSGQAAVPPAAPARDGHVFVRWEGAYENVYTDCEIRACYVQADSMNIFTVSSAAGSVGEEITVSVALTGTVQLCAYDMRLLYDADALEFVSMDAELSMDVTANKSADGRIVFNFSSTKNRTRGGGILDVTFRIKDSGLRSTTLTLEHKDVNYIDPNNKNLILKAAYTLCEGVVHIS